MDKLRRVLGGDSSEDTEERGLMAQVGLSSCLALACVTSLVSLFESHNLDIIILRLVID